MPTISTLRKASACLLTLLSFSLSAPVLPAQTRAPQTRAPQTRSTTLPPTLVVQITVDQLRPDYFDRFAPQLTGGLGRLMRNGARFTNAFHDHATTETAPGHATLWSGRYPAHTGVVLNDIGVADPQSPLLFGRGGGASPYRFRGSALFDWVRSNDQFSRALSVSRKDRGAILPLGRAKQNVFWYSLDGRFTTSRYYGDTIPTWVKKFNDTNFLARYLGTDWKLLLADSEYPEKDSVVIESQGKDFVFPHPLSADPRTGGNDFTEFPWMDDVTADFALAGVNALELGKGPTVDVLAVSFSTTDAIGHRYGPDSRELHDQVLRVDRAIGKLIDSLYKLRDSTRIVFALGADHGVAPFPELHFAGADPDRGRVDPRPVIDSARSKLAARGVEGDALLLQSGIISLDRARLAAHNVNADSVVEVLRAAMAKRIGVARVDLVSTLAAKAARGDKIARRWLYAVPPDLKAVLTVSLAPYYYWFTVRYATHGTPNDYDTHIPIIFMGPMFQPGTYSKEVRSVDVAPTLAAAIGIEPTEAVDGHILTEAFRKPTGKKR